jgi:hypothetical protein
MKEEELRNLSLDELNEKYTLRRVSNVESAQSARKKIECDLCGKMYAKSVMSKHKKDCLKIQRRKSKVKELYEQGLNATDIANELGIENSTTVLRDLRGLGLTTNWTLNAQQKRDTLRKMLKEGANNVQIAEAIGLSRANVCAMVKEMGLKSNFAPDYDKLAEQKEQFLKLWREGKRQKEISEIMGLPNSTIKAKAQYYRRIGIITSEDGKK